MLGPPTGVKPSRFIPQRDIALRNLQNSDSIPTVPGRSHRKSSPNTHGGLMFAV